eukprot:maker-scaffold_22-snap-gene-2.56-mRNA-1 protein AED:0.43 eAED:0.45 QI:0/0/0/0.75/0.33/0.25/4/0/208
MRIKKDTHEEAKILDSFSGDCKTKKLSIDTSDEEDAEVEWNMLKRSRSQGEIRVSKNPEAERIAMGFQILGMTLRDLDEQVLLWKAEKGQFRQMLRTEVRAYIPAKILGNHFIELILDCEVVSRKLKFYSAEEIKDFRIEQKAFFTGECIERFTYSFGFVIAGSTNSWEQIIEAKSKRREFPAEILSGNVTVETSFFDGLRMFLYASC